MSSINVDLEAGEQRFAMAGLRPDFPGLPGRVGGFENVNFYAARRWNSLLAPRPSKGRYRSPTGPACCMERTFRPRCPPGRTRARRPVAASAARSGPLRCMRMHSRTKMTSGGQSIYTSQRRGAGLEKNGFSDLTRFFWAISCADAACACDCHFARRRRRRGQPSHV